MVQQSRRYLQLASSLVLLATLACTRTVEPITPIAPVHVEVNLEASVYRPLASPGGMVVLTTPTTERERLGYGGILIARSLTSETTYYAYDLSCPHEASGYIRVAPQDLVVACPSCGSRFDVLHGSGSPISGVARAPLRAYHVRYNQVLRRLQITN